jgi:sec-independent protein translocase protein TatC
MTTTGDHVPSAQHGPPSAEDGRMSIGDHLEELRRRIIYALLGVAVTTTAAMVFGKQIIEVLKYPYVAVLEAGGMQGRPAALAVSDGFVTYLHVSLAAGVIAGAPWVFYQLWQFVAAGLHPHERRYVRWAVPLSGGLFICGAVFFMTVVSYPMLRFLLGFTAWLDLQPVIPLRELLGFMVNMTLVFGLAFQMPIVVFILGKIGLVTTRTLGKYRRHVVVAILVLAALVTSPSPVDQIGLAVPMWLLYELGIVLIRMFPPEGEAAVPDEDA